MSTDLVVINTCEFHRKRAAPTAPLFFLDADVVIPGFLEAQKPFRAS